MNTITQTLPQAPIVVPTSANVTPSAPAALRADVVVSENITIPGWINTLEEYRSWAESDDYPQTGWISYLDGQIWVDPSMEEFLTHNGIKQAFNYMFGRLLERHPVARFVPDRMFFANTLANLATEPDGLFYLWETMKSERLRPVLGKKKTGYMQLEGTPDGVLEILSDGSQKKDLERLRDLYWKAQIPEYWLVDVRKNAIRFEILRHAPEGYLPSTTEDGWVRSEVLQHSFRIERTSDPLGFDQFVVHVK